jgi:hypothetical protein
VWEHDGADVGEALAQVVVLKAFVGRPHIHPQPVGTFVGGASSGPIQQLGPETLAGVSAVDGHLVGIERWLGGLLLGPQLGLGEAVDGDGRGRRVIVVPDDEGLAGLDVGEHALDHEVFGRPGLLPLVDALAGEPGGGLVTVVAELSRLVEELIRKGRNVAIQVMLLTQRATGDAIPTRIRDNCQVAISFATRTLDGAVAALGEEIRQYPDASPVLLNDPAYVGVAVISLPGRPGFHRVRTPQVDHHQVAAIIRASAALRCDPGGLLPEVGPPLRLVDGTR